MRFGRLVAVEPTNKRNISGSVIWLTKCDCGKTSYVSTSSLVVGHAASCGCLKRELAASRCRDMVGPLSPSWKSELTEEERLATRNIHGYSEWRTAVYERDNYTCQKCGNIGGVLNSHHIEGYSSYKNKRTLLSNGITLCKDCHRNYHHVYGNDATREMFGEWMNEE